MSFLLNCLFGSSSVTLTEDNNGAIFDVSGDSVVATLPELPSNYNGVIFFIKIGKNNGLGLNSVTINPPDAGAGDRIDTSASIVLTGTMGIQIMINTDSSTGRHNFLVVSRT